MTLPDSRQTNEPDDPDHPLVGTPVDSRPPAVANDDHGTRPTIRPRHSARTALIHTRNLPLYWLRLISRAPAGAAELNRRIDSWKWDATGLTRLDPYLTTPAYAEAYSAHLDRIATRRRLVAVATIEAPLGLALLVLAAVPVVPLWGGIAATLAVLTLLGAIGRTHRLPIISRVVRDGSSPPITSDLVITALGSLGITELNKSINSAERAGRNDGGLGWPSPIREEGKGWRVDVDLPAGVTATQVIDKRDRLASGLRRPVSAVWPSADGEEHAARLVLFVSHRPMSQMRQGAWPLASRGTVDLFDSFPFGIDPRGAQQSIAIMYTSMVVGAIPRMGKTATTRLIVLAGGLDPRAELHIFDAKGGGDWIPLEPIAHYICSGSDDEDFAGFADDLDALHADMLRRYKIIKQLPRDICPESKVTRELAHNPELRLHPVIVVIDECHLAFTNPKAGGRIEERIEDLVRRGPAAGIIVILATQKPDAKSLPTGIRSNAVLRFCGKVTDATANNMVLGDGAYSTGINATLFARSERGVGWLSGEGDDPVIVRAYQIDGKQAEAIVARARAARVALGTLSGQALGIDDSQPEDRSTILDHLFQVWPRTESGDPVAKVWWDDLAKALADTFPTYAGWTPDAVREASGLRGVQIKGKTYDDDNNMQVVNRRGPAWETLLMAMADRNPTETQEPQ